MGGLLDVPMFDQWVFELRVRPDVTIARITLLLLLCSFLWKLLLNNVGNQRQRKH